MGIVHGGTGCGRGGAGCRKLDDPIVVEVRVVQLAQRQVVEVRVVQLAQGQVAVGLLGSIELGRRAP